MEAVRLPPAALDRRWLLVALTGLALVAVAAVPPVDLAAAIVGLVTVVVCLRWPVAALCLLAWSVPWSTVVPLPSNASWTTSDVLVFLLGLTLLRIVWREGLRVFAAPWTAFLLIFLVAIALSASQSVDRGASVREIIKWVEMLVVYVTSVHVLRTHRQLELIVSAVVTAGVSQALLGYVQSGYGLGPEAFVHGLFLRAYGTFDQPNPYAGYLNMIMPLAVAMGALAPSSLQRRLYRAAALVLFGALAASESRGALLAGVLALIVVLALIYRRIVLGTALAAGAALVGAWLAVYGLVPLGPFQRLLAAIGLGSVQFGNVNNANFSAVERAAHWLAGVRMFAAHPLLGVGIGNYADAYPMFHPRGWYAPLAHAHNYFINVAAEAGIVGLISYTLLAGSALWYTWAAMRRLDGRTDRAAVLGVLGALIATNIHNLFDVLYVHGMVALLGVLMALVPVAARHGRAEANRPLTENLV